MFGRLIQEEVAFLNDTEYKPVLSNIQDDGNILTITFNVKESKPIVLSHRDIDIINNDDEIKLLSILPRDEMVNKIRAIIKRREHPEISFNIPLAKELEQKIQECANTLLKPNYFSLVDPDFLLNSYTPIIAYNILKVMVNKLEKDNSIVPSVFRYALKRPNEYFNPVEVLHNDNAFEFQNSGVVSGI